MPFLAPSPPKSKLSPKIRVSSWLSKSTACVTEPTLRKFLNVTFFNFIIGIGKSPIVHLCHKTQILYF